MYPVSQTRQLDQIKPNLIAEWKLLPDEMVLEVFKHLNALERAIILLTSKQFNRLGTEASLLKEEAAACQGIIQNYIRKNKTSSLFKPLSELTLDWNNPWTALKTVGKIYRFGNFTLEELAGVDISCEKNTYPALSESLQNRYTKEVAKKIESKEGVIRFESGCKFSTETFRTFLEEINKNTKINKLVILCDLTPDQILVLAEVLTKESFRIPELFIKTERKFYVADLHHLFGAISVNTTLKSLQFYNAVANDELPIVIQALKNNQTLEKIALNGQQYTSAGFRALMECLVEKRKIISLTLAPLLYDELIQLLFEEIHFTAIQELEVQFLDISDATALTISTALGRCWRVKELRIPNKGMSEQAAVKIGEAIERNPRLRGGWRYKSAT